MIQLLLTDIRCNWGCNWGEKSPEDRALKAKSLCEEVTNETNNDEFMLLADFCDTYINSSKRWGDWDGRFFRSSFPMGYEKMDKLHKLKPTYNNKSKDFKIVVDEYITSPEVIFDDWEVQSKYLY